MQLSSENEYFKASHTARTFIVGSSVCGSLMLCALPALRLRKLRNCGQSESIGHTVGGQGCLNVQQRAVMHMREAASITPIGGLPGSLML